MTFQQTTSSDAARLFSWLAIAALVATVMVLPADLSAELATVQDMENVGHNWLTQTVGVRGDWAGVSDPQIIGTHEIRENGQLLARVYDVAPRGYVLVPALKEMPPVKIYSDESNWSDSPEFGVGQLIREELIERMEAFASTYGSVAEAQPAGGGVFDPVHKEAWSQYSVTTKEFRAAAALGAEAEGGPLLTSSWHQRAP